jgi:Ala-tRNA(Pro) deacylase
VIPIGDPPGDRADDPSEPLFAFLESLNVVTTTVGHPPVMTVAEAKQHRVETRGAHVKNLFLRNKKGRMWLVTLLEDRAIDLAELAKRIGAGHVSFGSPKRLRDHLGVDPGSVTPLAALNDKGGEVRVVLDAAILKEPIVHCHPLRNDRTTTLHTSDLVRFLQATGHDPEILDLDASGAPSSDAGPP